MNLLYIWNAAYSGAGRTKGHLLSGRYEITFAEPDGPLSIRRREDVFTGNFWGEHIYDVMAVIGRNGAGKTRLAYSIMETLDEADRLNDDFTGNQWSRFPFLLVFEDGEGRNLEIKIFTTKPELPVDTQLRHSLRCLPENTPYYQRKDLKKFKFAYFTDTLSLMDYKEKKYGVVYDGSLGGSIRKAFESNLEMSHINSAMSPIINYFNDEMKKILEFLCLDQEQEGLPFVRPKRVDISPADFQVNLNYISDELDRMRKPDGKNILSKACGAIQKKYGRNMRSALAIHLMLNLFKTFCIPQTSSENLSATADAFLDKINCLECCGKDAFDVALRLLDEVRGDSDPIIIGRYQNALQWMKKQSALQGDRWKREWWSLDLKKEQETVLELFSHYRETNFPYPYLSFSFGLSTGEFAFLRRFVRVNEVLCQSVAERCGGLMLYFDEADQSLHPEWQRRYLDWMLQFVSARLENCAAQLVIATHSPIMLSDIPRDHILYMRNNGEEILAEKREVRTFGSNIHNLFLDAFFLEEGTMGAFAERKINETARSLGKFSGRVSMETQALVEEIGDDVIRGKLRQMCQISPSQEGKRPDDGTIRETVRLLKGQVERLEAAIRELEPASND